MSKAGIAILILILAAGGVGLIMLYLSPPIRPSTGMHTANSDGSNPGYPFELLDDKPEKPPLGGRLFILACGLVAACLAVSLMVPK